MIFAPRVVRASGVALFLALSICVNAGCSSVMKADNSTEILKNSEFDNAIKVEEISSEPKLPVLPPSGMYVSLPGPTPVAPAKKTKVSKADRKAGRKAKAAAKMAETADMPTALKSAPVGPAVHEPSIEDGEGFEGRRPKVDPYHVGEKVTLEVSYFGVVAGDMTMETRPYVEVNGRKSYKFLGTAVSTSVFAMFYAIDDWFETYLDFETLLPSSYALHVKESKQLRETRSVFDWQKLAATWWDKKIDSEQKVEEKKKEWEIPAYSQNIFTAAYYLRNFNLRPGKKIAFRVAHEGENLVVTAEVMRREKLSTAIGDIDTVVVRPHVELNGVFKPVGEMFLWLTDDDRKFIVRIESKIKIGTVVGAVKKIETGTP